jgi:probable phosphoglycerate mutase
VLVRHGETEWNRIHRFQGRSDQPLNKTGQEQADALAMALKNESFSAVYTSPLTRAMETALAIKVFHPSAPIFEEEGLIEMDLGDFDGMEGKKWITEYPDLRRIWQATPSKIAMPGGESLIEVQDRATEAVDRITGSYPSGSTLLLSSHNFVIITILCYATGIHLDQFRTLRQGTAAYNVLYKEGEILRAEIINELSHLENLNTPS